MSDLPKDIPAPGADWRASLQTVTRLQQEVRRLLGFNKDVDKLDKALTRRDLLDGGYLEQWIAETPSPAPAPSPSEAPDLTEPPQPTGLDVTAGISHILVQWDAPLYTQGHGNQLTSIYAVQQEVSDPDLPTFSDAVVVDQAPGGVTVRAIPSEPNMRWHVWITHTTNDGVESVSPAGGVNGVGVTTGQDVEHLLSVLQEQITGPLLDPDSTFFFKAPNFAIGSDSEDPIVPFIVHTAPTVENGVPIPAGVYMDGAYVVNLTAMWAKIGTLFTDRLDVAQLNAAKLTLGDGSIGGNLKSTSFVDGVSGWRLTPGGSLRAYGDAVFGGTLAAASGTFAGSLSAATGSFIGSITAASGSIGGIAINATGIQSSNYVPNVSGFRLASNGTAQMPAANIIGKLRASQIESPVNASASHVFVYSSVGLDPSWVNYPASVQKDVLTFTKVGPESVITVTGNVVWFINFAAGGWFSGHSLELYRQIIVTLIDDATGTLVASGVGDPDSSYISVMSPQYEIRSMKIAEQFVKGPGGGYVPPGTYRVRILVQNFLRYHPTAGYALVTTSDAFFSTACNANVTISESNA